MRVDFPSRLPLIAVVTALLLLAWVLAHWTWAFLLPRQQGLAPSLATPLLSKVLAEKVVALHLFGGSLSDNVAELTAPVAAPSNIGVKGVYAGRDGRSGFAVLVLDGKPLSAVVGQEFAPGISLQRVYPDFIEIQRAGQVETVRMAEAPLPGAANLPANSLTLPGGVANLQMTVRQLGERQYGFSRTELLSLLKRPDQMMLLGRYGPHPRGGAVLEQSPSGGLPEKLGLKVGDVVTGINGKPLSGPGDVARLYQLLIKNERVSVDVLRSGNKMDFGLQVTS
jgi:general secretion pathway protein C